MHKTDQTSEPLLGVIPEQRACPLRPKGARSKAKNKKGARSRKRVILEQGAEIFQTKRSMEQKTVILEQGTQLFHGRALKKFAATPLT